MSWRGQTTQAAALVAALWSFTGSAHAADLDEAYAAAPPPPPPRAYAGAGGRIVDPRCRVIPQPELDLYGNTARFRPTVVCMSRGLLADSFGPYPFYYPYYNR